MDRLPVDVALYILRFCRLQDTLAVALVCTSLNALTTQRGFWITALQNERHFKPIACTHNEDLTKHELARLRTIALRTLRLERNWTSEKPQLLGPVKTVVLGLPRLDTLFQIPGTWLYVFHCPATECIELWDVGQGKKIAEPIPIGRNVWDVSPGEDLCGKFSMGLLAAKDNGAIYKLMVVCVKHGGTNTPTLCLTLEVDLISPAEHWAVFIDVDVVGTLCYSYEMEKLCVTAVNRSTGQQTFITTDLPSEEVPLAIVHMAQSGTAIVKGDLCIIFAETYRSWIFTLPRRYLPTNDNPACLKLAHLNWGPNFATFGNLSDDEDEDEPESIHLNVLTANDTYGVLAISLDKRDTWEHSNTGGVPIRRELGLTAWVTVPPSDSNIGFPVHLEPLPLEEAIAGTLQSLRDPETDNPWLLIVQTLSGRKSLLLTNITPEDADPDIEEQLVLRLVHCEPEAENEDERIYYRDLEIPSFINLSKVHGLFLDDHMGVVTMVDTKGVLYALPMA
ncbi:hypothetical protein CPB83DRAFT_893246 [Crepidotus variabilis]|uniref:F-box domain-containing protein n=1 Tax=Crepidotus variabilis TaxID=179855 RepID=A0A9P6JQJ8_9AGAR|nr:hypothetical protein CPB83DRAFT_893246 [Crepidotus variabilis]